ncbi:TPA: hypothetical protein HA278_02340 [Candidatus Woesearchaeota archaeon]|nr:hypothetical protein [archaeon]HIJ10875.1 hypothetical protein [Candidatus Woesearchaeota archaeon]|tara:strand:+ start:176 stop:433 length:258 start_codon:yes stop_codon:yes gene_type:complete
MQFTLTKCKTKAAYSAKLVKQGKLDLKKITKEFSVMLETPILLVIKEQDVEIIVHGYGELLFKRCTNVAKMRKIAEKVYEIGMKH